MLLVLILQKCIQCCFHTFLIAICYQVTTIHIKPTRAYLALRQATKTHLDQLLPARYEEAHPLRWRKVKSAGSYHTESQLWHHHTPQLSPQFMTSGTETGFSALSMLATIPLRTETSGAEVHAGCKSPSYEHLGDVYASKPKILHPSQSMVPMSPPTMLIAAGNSSDSTSTNGSSSLSLASSVNASKLYPLRQKVPCPSYMSLTTSSNAKRKLRPSFTSSYNSLEFVRSGPKNAARLQDQLSSRTSKASSVSNLAQLSESSFMGMAPKVAENTSSAVDLAYISSAADLTYTRPRSKTFTVGNGKNSFELRVNLKRTNTSEPNIRNKSAIIHTPKWVSPRATKAR